MMKLVGWEKCQVAKAAAAEAAAVEEKIIMIYSNGNTLNGPLNSMNKWIEMEKAAKLRKKPAEATFTVALYAIYFNVWPHTVLQKRNWLFSAAACGASFLLNNKSTKPF